MVARCLLPVGTLHRDFQRQNNQKSLRCHRTSVSGCTTVSTRRQSTRHDRATSAIAWHRRRGAASPGALRIVQLLSQKQILGGELGVRSSDGWHEAHEVAGDTQDSPNRRATLGPHWVQDRTRSQFVGAFNPDRHQRISMRNGGARIFWGVQRVMLLLAVVTKRFVHPTHRAAPGL